MISKHYLTAVATLAIAAGVQWVSMPTYATERGEQRQEAGKSRRAQEARNAVREMKKTVRNVGRTSARPSMAGPTPAGTPSRTRPPPAGKPSSKIK